MPQNKLKTQISPDNNASTSSDLPSISADANKLENEDVMRDIEEIRNERYERNNPVIRTGE